MILSRKARLAGLALVALPVLAIVVLRLVPPPRERSAARATMEQPVPPVRGRDATNALWLLDRAVPPSQQARVGAAYRHWLDQRELLLREARTAEAEALPDPLAKYPKLVDAPKDAPGICHPFELERCLATVRDDPARSEALLVAHAPQLRAAQALRGYDGARVGLLPGAAQPFLPLGAGRTLALTAIAARFVRGDQPGAIAEACTDLAAWRRLGTDSDSIVGAIGPTGSARQDLVLLASMLGELPASTPLPAQCTPALEDATDAELDLCPALRGEFAQLKELSKFDANSVPRERRFWTRLFLKTVDADRVSGFHAPALARYCGARALANARADRSARRLPEPNVACERLEWVARPGDCLLASIAVSNWADYVDRRTDLAAELALMRTWLWLRAQDPDPATWARWLPTRPERLGLRREPRVDLAGGKLEIDLLTRVDKTYALPLPQPPDLDLDLDPGPGA
jgi:hypothetical protein